MSFDDKRIKFAGAGHIRIASPRNTLGKLLRRALTPLGYEVEIDGRGFGHNNQKLVSSGELDLGAVNGDHARWAYEGKFDFAGNPRRNLRVIAAICRPWWLGVAVRSEKGINDLAQIKERQLPLRLRVGAGPYAERIFAYYGLTPELIESWGGVYHGPPELGGPVPAIRDPWVRTGDFDLIVNSVYAAFTPENRDFFEASVLYNLRFLPLPDDLIEQICREVSGVPGFLPHQLLRGVDGDIPSVELPPQVIYTRDDAPDDLAYLVAKTLDENWAMLRQTMMAFSYDPKVVASDVGIPLHPGAARYYQEVGYLRAPVGARPS
jgi:TRAP-type uncharacterized transport system substrate-binding protein